MALELSDNCRNAMLDALAKTAGRTPKIEFRSSDNMLIADFRLPQGWAGTAKGGVLAMDGMPWICGQAPGEGTVASFKLIGEGGLILQGSVGTSQEADMRASDIHIIKGQTVRITSWSITAP